MKNVLTIFVSLVLIQSSFSQVTINPVCFSDTDEITIIYDATKGSSGLIGAAKVYMHGGVVTDSETGTNWQHVVGNWGTDDGIGEMTKVSGESDKWEITLIPRTYYDVPSDEIIYRLSMVFRNADGTKEGKDDSNGDIYINLATDPVNLQITSDNPILVDNGDIINITATTCSSAAFNLFINNVLETTQMGSNQFDYDYTIAQSAGNVVQVKLTAEVVADINTQEFAFSVRTPSVSEPRPIGVVEGVNYGDDPTKATLVLLAPNKASVYIIGDFNNWLILPDYQMKKDGEYFWVEIEGLTSGKEYVFQYLIDETIRLADPYTDKISDPWEDKYIDEATYPGLIEYPSGRTTNRAAVLQTGQTPYNWTSTSFKPVAKEKLVIYELLIRDFDIRHSYKGVLDRLDYLESLGVNAIEFMPTNEFEGNLSWGYNPNFYFAPDKYYGPKNDFKALIDECHNRGIAVIIDLVLNHSYNSSPMARMYWNNSANRPAADNPWFNESSNFENTDAHWGSDLNHESVYTKNFIDSVNTYWMEEYNVDGFRFDFTKGFSNNFKSNSSDSWGSLYDADRIANLKRMSDVIWKKNPNAYVIFEHLSDNREEEELADFGIMLWGNMVHDYNEISMGYAANKSIDWGYYKTRGWAENNVVAYMESHDEERQMFKNQEYGNTSGNYDVKTESVSLKRSGAAAAFFFTVPGPKMIWQFGEYGYDISIDENGRVGEKPILWEYLEEPNRKMLFDKYSALISLRNRYDVFSTGDFTWQPDGNFKSIHISNADTSVVILGNFDVESAEMAPDFQHTGTWYDFFSGAEITVDDINATLSYGPGEYHIYTDKKLHTPDIVLGIENEIIISGKISVYPNPTSNILHIYIEKNEIFMRFNSWSIINAMGKEVMKGELKEFSGGAISVLSLPLGIYTFFINNSNLNPIQFIKN